MPGIVGLLTAKPREWAEPQLLRMVEALRHENFYVTGTWMDESLGIYVGWIVQKGSFSDGMPIWNERGDVGLVFSGEEFPDPGTVSRLKKQGHRFDEKGPSYLVHLYETDPSFPAGLNGRFHGLLTDRNRGTTTLFNDRYGMHRIYYYESRDAFYFAAEAKGILTVRPELRRLDPRGLGELVSCGCVLEWRSLFPDIYVLPGGAVWDFQNGSIKRKGTYFQPREWEEQEALEPGAYYQEFRETFSRNLPRYFASNEQIGMSLTGGLDTRMIMAWHKPAPSSLPCYTWGGMFRDCQDVIIARQVARVCEQSHKVISVGEEFLARFAHYAERSVHLTDGCVDVSHSADLFINEKAREVAPVRMTGLYGGEVLRSWRSRESSGVRAFKPVEPLPGLFTQDFLSRVHEARETYAQLIQGHPLSFNVFRQAPWHHYGSLALEGSQLSMRSPFLDNDLIRTVFRAPESACANDDICLRLIGDGSPPLRQILTDRGLGGVRGSFTAAASRALLEFLFKAEYGYDYGMPQWVAQIDHLLSVFHFQRLFLGRHKTYHYRVWYRDVLSGYVREVLLDRRSLSRPYLDRRRLESMVEGHLKGNRNYTTEIHKVLTLELLHRIFVDSQ
jgi:asparagine synthase (glutamine-hydrolysing)